MDEADYPPQSRIVDELANWGQSGIDEFLARIGQFRLFHSSLASLVDERFEQEIRALKEQVGIAELKNALDHVMEASLGTCKAMREYLATIEAKPDVVYTARIPMNIEQRQLYDRLAAPFEYKNLYKRF